MAATTYTVRKDVTVSRKLTEKSLTVTLQIRLYGNTDLVEINGRPIVGADLGERLSAMHTHTGLLLHEITRQFSAFKRGELKACSTATGPAES
jgi:hypothetical protein